MISATTTNNELPDAAGDVKGPICCLRGKPLVDMIVPIQDKVYIMLVKDVPYIKSVVLCAPSRAKKRNMPVSQCAEVRMGS